MDVKTRKCVRIDPLVSDGLICQVDLVSSLAELTGMDERGMDSEPLLPVLLGESVNGGLQK